VHDRRSITTPPLPPPPKTTTTTTTTNSSNRNNRNNSLPLIQALRLSRFLLLFFSTSDDPSKASDFVAVRTLVWVCVCVFLFFLCCSLLSAVWW
jgi:hypothetical protein